MIHRDMLSIGKRLRHKGGSRCNLKPAEALHQPHHYKNRSCSWIIPNWTGELKLAIIPREY
jgi:hypothetical protein